MSSFAREVVDGYRVAARVIFPADGDLDVLPLYVDRNAADRNAGVRLRPDDVLSRLSLRVRAGQHVSLGSYFNAFAASYWRRWTVAQSVRLEVVTSGPGQLVVYRTNARGNQMRVDSAVLSGDQDRHVFDLPLKMFGDGGWYWFDLNAGSEDLVLDHATWWVPESGQKFGTATIQTTTVNKNDYILRNLNLEAEDPDLLAVLDEIIVVDQGTQKVRQAEGFTEVAAKLGDQLDVIEQANLGGSGGFARGQYEATVRGKSDYVILMDDDISIEPETVVRMVTFADMCKSPTLVGGHMFDLLNRSVLHTFGEIVDRETWVPSVPRPNNYLGHDFNRRGLREATWMHSRVDVDYNGWWCCLIPTAVVREIGLSLPLFLKWDDSEYGLRALKAGYPTVSLPGAAVWHIGWGDKDDLVGWQSYFHNRNRIITALMHSPLPHGGSIIKNAEINDIKHLVSMQYFTVKGRVIGEEDVLAGPEKLHEILPQRIGEIRALAKEFPDAELRPDYEDFPPAPPVRPAHTIRPKHMAFSDSRIEQDYVDDEERPVSRKRLALMGLKALARQFTKVDPQAMEKPQTVIRHVDNQWWKVSPFDSALVTNAEGTGISWYRRDRAQMKELLAQSMRNYARIYKEWDELAARYRAALPELVSFEAWEKTWGISNGSPRQ